MAFNPKPEIDEIFQSGEKRFKVKSFNASEVVVVRLKADGTEEDSTFTWTEKQWTAKKLIQVHEVHQEESQTDKSDTFTFDVDKDGNLTILKGGVPIKEFNLRGPEGKPGKDGAPGQNGAQGQAGKDGADGRPGINGERGQDGKNGVDGAPGKDGAPGPQGPVGPVYIPHITPNGDLSWTNNGEDLPNPTPINIKGDKGPKGDNGSIFRPVIKDGMLYWVNEQGEIVSKPQYIIGPQGEKGERGTQGLSAYDIWRSLGNRGSELDFINSLKGDKGEPAKPANFSFKDVEDYTCDIQRIDTHLIEEYDYLTPEKIIDERIQEIHGLREKGKEDVKKISWLKRFMWWCAGADKNLLAECPGDQTKYVGIGTTILFTALMAWFSSFIAMRLVFPKTLCTIGNFEFNYAAALFATFWGAMIFCLDRFITNTMYSDGKVTISKKEFLSGLPRIIIAIILGVIISAPLELEIFKNEIANDNMLEIINIKNNYIKNDSQRERLISENDSTIRHLKEQIEYLEIQNSRYAENIKSLIERAPKQSDYVDRYDNDGALTWSAKNQYDSYYKKWLKTKEGKNYTKYSELQAKNEITIDSIRIAINNSTALIKDSVMKSERTANDKFTTNYNSDGLLTQLKTLHKLGTMGYSPWFYDIKDVNPNKCAVLVDTILHKWWWFLLSSAIGLIMLLFILIDISPVFYKMMLADGKYDNYLHQEKLLAQDKIRLSLAKMLKQLNESDLKRVAPFVMGDIYSKMAGDSYIYKTEEEFERELLGHKKTPWYRRLWPLNWIIAIFWKEEEKPSAPVIVFELKDDHNKKLLAEKNRQIFEAVLKAKEELIISAYNRWFKTQKESIICEDIQENPLEDYLQRMKEESDELRPENDNNGGNDNVEDFDETDDFDSPVDMSEEPKDTKDQESDESQSTNGIDSNNEEEDPQQDVNKENNTVDNEIETEEQELPDDNGDDITIK